MTSQIISLTLKNLKKIGMLREIPNISEQNAEFLKQLIREKNPKHLLEIGTANGYSTLHFSTAISDISDITTLEQAWNMHNDAVTNFKNCKIKNIHAIWGDAKLVLPKLAENFFDFVYIDAMKKEYLQYLLLALPKMTPDAMIVIDDVEKFRDKMEDLFDYLDGNRVVYQFEKTDIDDSIMILYKKDFLSIGE
ncbi:hypothetical protein HOO68_03265 [Candidatus Gracilibacteria bacterium]|nr:hypothetical protein [Candidatus Gracilibacteria bacterium]